MKRIIYYPLILFVFLNFQLVNAQIRTRPPMSRVVNKEVRVEYLQKTIIPSKGNIRLLRVVNDFSRMNNLKNNRKILFNTASRNTFYTGTQTNSRFITKPIITSPRGSNYNSSNTLKNYSGYIMPSITKNIRGTNITYTLQKSETVSSWGEGAEIKPKKIGVPSSDNFNPNTGLNCHTTTLTFNCQSKSFMNAQPESQGAALIPGMIFTFEDITNGNFTHQVMNNNRYPITLSVNTTSQGANFVDIPNPSYSSLNQAISTLRNGFGGNPSGAGGSDALYSVTKTETSAEESLAINAGGSYGSVSLKGSFSQNDSKYHLYYTIDGIKEMFTISPSSDSSRLYPANYQMPTNGGFPVMVGPVVYGARVLANMDIAFDQSSNAGALQFNYDGIGASAFADIQAAVKNKQATVSINGLLVGFPQKFPGSFSSNSIDEFLSTVNNFYLGCDYLSAKPIQYTLVDLEGNEMGISSFTDKTLFQECTPANEHFVLQSVTAKLSSGDDSKNDNSEFWLSVAAGSPLNPKWSGQFYDNHQEFKKEGNDHYIELGKISPTSLDDFQKGGFIALKLIEHGHTGDDWDINTLSLNFNFVSEHGLTKTIPLNINSLRISAGNYDKNILFGSGGTGSFMVK